MSQTTIEFTELLGRRVRMGPWEDQKISTYRKILEALDEGRWDDAAQLEAYFVDEAMAIQDDHLPFLRAGIPAVDIIDLDYPTWHTEHDTIDKVSGESMQVVGDVLLAGLPDVMRRRSR